MGVLGLWQIIESVGHPIKLEAFEGKRLGVDANIWLYKFIRGFREKDNPTSIDSHKLGLFNRICKLLFYKIKPVFVFDGPAPVLKRRTLERRQNVRNKELAKVQDAAMKLLAEQLKEQYPNANIDDIRIQLPEFRSNTLVAAEKLTDEDRDLFYLPPIQETIHDDDSEEEDVFSDDEFEEQKDLKPSTQHVKQENVVYHIDSDDEYHEPEVKPSVDIDSKDFESLPPEVRYEILVDIRDSRKKRRRAVALPEDAGTFSSLQLERLKARRLVQEKIEKCEKDICSTYTGEMNGQSVRSYRVQSDSTKTMLYLQNRTPKFAEHTAPHPEVYRPETNIGPNNDLVEGTQPSTFLEEKSVSRVNRAAMRPLFDIPSDRSPAKNIINIRAAIKDFSDSKTKKRDLSSIKSPQISESSGSDTEIEEYSSQANTSDKTIDHQPKISSSSSSSSSPIRPTPNNTVLIESSPSPERSLRQSKSRSLTPNEPQSPSSPTKARNETILIESSPSPSPSPCRSPISPSINRASPEPSQLNSKDLPCTTEVAQTDIVESEAIELEPKQTKAQEIEVPKIDEPEEVVKKLSEDKQPVIESSQLPGPSSQSQQAGNKETTASQRMNEYMEAKANSNRVTNKVTAKIVEEAKELLRLFGVPYIDAAGEAEAQCALLEELKLTEGTITDDSDVWLFGAKNVYRHFFNDDKFITQYKMSEIEFHLRMTRENLVCFAMLVGSDYTDGIMNIGPVTAIEIISEFPAEGLGPLVKFKNWKMRYEQSRGRVPGSKKREKFLKYRLPEDFPSRAVFDGYVRPMADSSTEQFTWGMPDLDELREYARRNFAWDIKKIDDKLLPVMKRLNERRTQPTIDSFFFRTAANENPERYRSKRVNEALNKIGKTAAQGTSSEICLTDSDSDNQSNQSDTEPADNREQESERRPNGGARGRGRGRGRGRATKSTTKETPSSSQSATSDTSSQVTRKRRKVNRGK